MWKLSCIVLSFITIGNSTAHDHPGTTEISRNFRNYENQRYDSEDSRSRIEYTDDDEDNDRRRISEDYSRSDSEEFEGDKLIGKWRNSGSAFEPKWRDGDSLPLVPFNDAPKQKKFTVHDVTSEETKFLETSRVTARFDDPEKSSNRDHNEETKIPVSPEYRPGDSDETEDRYSLEDDYERIYNPYPLRNGNNGFSRREKSTRFPTMTGEVTKNLEDSTSRADKQENKELSYGIDEDEASSRLRYRNTFQTHPNEYELMEDEEAEEEYQKPRPRKRRPPQNYEFHENRPPTYSITWSTERYTESMGNLDKLSTRKIETTTTRRGSSEKRNSGNRDEVKMDSPRSSENTELRSLLKMQQIEGLSLSELLQRRNLTLNDLLRGKPEVLNALKSGENDNKEIIGQGSKIYEPDISANGTERNKWQTSQSTRERTANSTFNEISTISKSENDVGINETTRKRDDENESMEKMNSAETEAGRMRSNENEKISAIVRLTRPIILPRFHFLKDKTRILGARKNKLDGKKNESLSNLDDDEIMEFSDFNVKKIETTTSLIEETRINGSVEKFDEDSGSTLSIENILSPTQQTAATLTINETNGFTDTKVNTVTTDGNNSDVSRIIDFDYQSDEPRGSIKDEVVKADEEIVIDSEELTMSDGYEKTTLKIDEIFHDNDNRPPMNHQIFPTNGKPYEVVVSEIEPEARAEIFELFSSGSSAKRLKRLLKSRNMSIDELIALRQRGSSKVHLAEVSRSREEMTNSRNYKSNDRIIGKSSIDETTMKIQLLRETTTDDLSDIEIDSTTRETTKPETIEEQTNISSIGTDLSKNDEKNEQLLLLLRAFDSLPFSVPPESAGAVKTHRTDNESSVETKKSQDFSRNLVEIGLVEEILEKDSTTIDRLAETNILKNYSTTRSTDERQNLAKVRPSIIASGAILGVTIVVFFAIFVVCRIRQKQRYTYRNTFSRAVFQGPAMTARKLSNTSSLNTIMVNVVATSTTKRPERRDNHDNDENFESKSDIENDSLDANDSWETIPDFMK